MSKYIDDECKDCDGYIEPYGCTDHNCIVYQDWKNGMLEMMADFDHDKRRDERMEE